MSLTEDGFKQTDEYLRLRDENEQLRTMLEATLEDNTRISEDRETLRRRIAMLGRELRIASAVQSRSSEEHEDPADATDREKQNHAEEELRVAFEELQVLAEELEVANNSLHQSNQALERRVSERTSELASTNASLMAAEMALRMIADLVPDLLWRADSDGQMTWHNGRWYEYTGLTVEQSLGSAWAEAIHPDDREGTESEWAQSVRQGTSFECEHRLRAADGAYRWFLVRAAPLRGEFLQWFGSVTDIHDRRSAMEALEQSELRFRSLVEGMPQLVWRAVDGGKWTWSSRQWTGYTGMSEEDSLEDGWLAAVHPDDRHGVAAAWERAAVGDHFDIECRIFHAREGRHRHFRSRATAVRDATTAVPEWIGTSTDIDDLLQLQAQQAVLVAELQHRTRNLMAVVQSMTLRTLDNSPDLETFAQSITDRLSALRRVQGLLSRRKDAVRVTFDALIHDEISAHVPIDKDGNGPQVRLSGPSGIELRSSTVQTFALAMHELATNAVKYGALSQLNSRLDVTWHVEQAEAVPERLVVHWRESGVQGLPGPGVTPIGSGMGRELIERALPFQLGARTKFEFADDGVHCLIEMPVPEQGDGRENDHA